MFERERATGAKAGNEIQTPSSRDDLPAAYTRNTQPAIQAAVQSEKLPCRDNPASLTTQNARPRTAKHITRVKTQAQDQKSEIARRSPVAAN